MLPGLLSCQLDVSPQLCGALLALGFVWQPARFEKLTQGLQDYALQDDQVLGLLQVSLGLRGQASYSPRGTPHEACPFLKPFSQGGEKSKGKSLCPPGTDSLTEGEKCRAGQTRCPARARATGSRPSRSQPLTGEEAAFVLKLPRIKLPLSHRAGCSVLG